MKGVALSLCDTKQRPHTTPRTATPTCSWGRDGGDGIIWGGWIDDFLKRKIVRDRQDVHTDKAGQLKMPTHKRMEAGPE